jgi:hypothetical protein
LSIIQGPFSVAPCQTLVSRFATFASPYDIGVKLTRSCVVMAASAAVARTAACCALVIAASVAACCAASMSTAADVCANSQIRFCRDRFPPNGFDSKATWLGFNKSSQQLCLQF